MIVWNYVRRRMLVQKYIYMQMTLKSTKSLIK